jgi:hypothetical protein
MPGACLGLEKKISLRHQSLVHSPNQRCQNLCGMMHEVNVRYNDQDGKTNMTNKLLS